MADPVTDPEAEHDARYATREARFDDGACRCKELSATFDGLGYSKIGSTRNTRLVIRRCMIFSAPVIDGTGQRGLRRP